uniref:alpha,alpha-trehalose-phosphate synthase (UDP-forming) n=1 Tax=Globodera rostochiensis TaxID=31243 RepID=A0A914HFI8_GLORO
MEERKLIFLMLLFHSFIVINGLNIFMENTKAQEEGTRRAILRILGKLNCSDGLSDDCTFDQAMIHGIDALANIWRKRDVNSEIAFQGLLSCLEYCMQQCFESVGYFEHFVSILGYNTVQFWKAAIPYIYESDMAHGTKYRDALLFSLTLYDVNTGRNRLKEFYAAIPGIRKSLLGSHAKRFGEQFHHMQQRRTMSTSSSLYASHNSLSAMSSGAVLANGGAAGDQLQELTMALGNGTTAAHQQQKVASAQQPSNGHQHRPSFTLSDDDADGPALQHQQNYDVRRGDKRMSISALSNGSDAQHSGGTDGMELCGGLVNTQHFQQRVINVSNAPPVALKQSESGEWEIKQGSGGLVSCVDPVMSENPENMWLANLGMNIDKFKITSTEYLERMCSDERMDPAHIAAPATNTLGLPLMKQALADVLFHVIANDELKEEDEPADKKQIREEMSLLGVLNNYNRGTYKLNPVIVQEQDYNVYYGGISNGLLWPALHNLPEYILPEYNEPNVLSEHWFSYVRVNYQFAIDAVRNSRPQDFIWIHDYHLMLTGMIMQSLERNLEIGFFLHIPFQPPDDFFERYRLCAFPILRGLLRFTKVGFQTHRDRTKFIQLVRTHLPTAKVRLEEEKLDVVVVTYQGWSCSLGVFPVSIKNEDFLKVARDAATIKRADDIRKEIFGENPAGDVCLFFSVERFDYTKGIKEKLMAYQRYLEKHPERAGKDILFQVAVTNRRSVDTYRVYQDECMALAEATNGLQRSELIAHYLAMDIGVVTPKKDGMNLVAKEMLLCNPTAGLVLSTGAGSEIQFTTAGLHSAEDPNYHRVEDLFDTEAFADSFHTAAVETKENRHRHGNVLNEFIMANDIERWSATFLDPSWSHQVIRQMQVTTLDEFFNLMLRTRDVRRGIVERVLKGIPIRPHFSISLQNAKESLKLSCEPGTSQIRLRATATTSGGGAAGMGAGGNEDGTSSVPFGSAGGGRTGEEEMVRLDIKNEIEEFDKDLQFLQFIHSDDVYNIEQFISHLQVYHPVSEAMFRNEVAAVVDLFIDADHFNYFFTDRDGTLKSYSCSYVASIQPAYSGVIQAQFARRCAQTCAIVTTAPMMRLGILDVCTIPEGYYYIGASAGREWFVDPANKFKDQSIPEADLEKLNYVFDSISDLLEHPEFKIFAWIGSGLQKHYGHVTLAHQDVFGTVSRELKELIDRKIRAIVEDTDPSRQLLEVKTTETDIKIFIKSEFGHIFDKGNGIQLLIEHLKCDLREGTILVCGDSETDIPMLRTCLEHNPKSVYTVWVAPESNVALRQKVAKLCESFGNEHFVFVSSPEVLLGAMAQATIREISISRGAMTSPHHRRHSSSNTQLEDGEE